MTNLRKEMGNTPIYNMKKRILALTMALACVFTGCGATNPGKGEVFTIEKDGKTVDEVSEAYAWLYTLMYKDQYEAFFGDTFWDEMDEDGVTYAELFKEDLIDEIKMMKVIALEAEAAGVTLTEEELQTCKDTAAEYTPTIEEETRKNTGIDEEVFTEFEADFAIYEKYKTELLSGKDVSVDRESVRQSDLFVLYFPTVDYTEDGEEIIFEDDEKAEVKKQADAAYALLESGKTMEQTAEANDMDPEECMMVAGKTAEADQDEYYDAAFEEAAFSLKEGEYSKVVEGMDGYYIIQMVSLENEEETNAALESAEAEAGEALFTPILEEMLEQYEVTMNEKNWEKIDFKAEISFIEDASEEEDDIEIEETTDDEVEAEG